MPDPIRFYFDFASPYAYFAAHQIDAIGAEFARAVEWRPMLVWAVLKAQGIAAPMEASARRTYLLHDMQRSAAYFGLPFREPVRLPISTHLAARLYHVVASGHPDRAAELAERLFDAFFVNQRDISDIAALSEIAVSLDIPGDAATEAIKGPAGRALLEQAVAQAVADGVIGSPHFVVDGEGFFGVDRLPQLRWHLGRSKA